MTLVSPSQSNPGDEIRADSINDPVNQITAVINGNLDDTNISGVSGSKVAAGTITNAKLSTAAGEVGGVGTYTPTLTNITLGTGGSAVGNYVQVGKLVNFSVLITLGTSGSSVGTGPTISLPVTADGTGYDYNNSLIGTVMARDASPAANNPGFLRIASTTTVNCLFFSTSSNPATGVGVTSSLPFTWAASDILWVQGTYRAA